MKVIVFNCSPRMNEGTTAQLLNPFVEGMKEVGAEIELFYTKRLNIKPCEAEYTCWFKTPGKCMFSDDMNIILPKMEEANIWVFGTPVYSDNIPGQIKILLDRRLPMLEPYFILRNNHCRHPLRNPISPRKIVLLSTCAFHELDNFDPLIINFKHVSNNVDRVFIEPILRSQSLLFEKNYNTKLKGVINEIIKAAKKAGSQLIEKGKIDVEILNTISKDLMPKEEFVTEATNFFNTMIELNKQKTVAEWEDDLIPY